MQEGQLRGAKVNGKRVRAAPTFNVRLGAGSYDFSGAQARHAHRMRGDTRLRSLPTYRPSTRPLSWRLAPHRNLRRTRRNGSLSSSSSQSSPESWPVVTGRRVGYEGEGRKRPSA